MLFTFWFHVSLTPQKTIADRLGQYVSAYTLYSSVRPFGTSTIVATMTEKEQPSLYMIEPSGVYWVSRCVRNIWHKLTGDRDTVVVLLERVNQLPRQKLKSWIWKI